MLVLCQGLIIDFILITEYLKKLFENSDDVCEAIFLLIESEFLNKF